MKLNKKAQLTVFIIIGIIILSGFGLYIYVSSQKAEIIPYETIVEEIPVQFQPLRAFVESCLIKISTEALTRIGNSGGYVDLAANAISSNPAEPTESNAFRFFPGDENSEIAYWLYFKSSNTCRTNCMCDSEMPYLRKEHGTPSIEAELEKYIDLNMKTCLDDFKSFKQRGYIIEEKGELKTTATIAENDIPILVEYPINVKKEDSKTDIKNFFVRIPLNLNRIYELASEITRYETIHTYLERWTQEEINAFGIGVDETSIPPTSASSFDPGHDPVEWSKSKSKELLTNNIFPYYIPFFQVFNTANYIHRTDYYARTTLPIGPTGSYSDLIVEFEYLNWWPIYLDITGRGVNGDSVSPETASFPLLEQLGVSLGLHRYDFYYDISYPVRIHIEDSAALNNKGYHFYIGLEANVRDNKPLNCSGSGIPTLIGPTGSLLCDNAQRCANVTIIVNDSKTNEQLEDVLVSYGTNEQCDIGRTSQSGDKIMLNASLPSCVGCSLFLSKQGYFSYPLLYTVSCDNQNCDDENVLCNDETLTLKIEPKRTINATVKKMTVTLPIENVEGTVDAYRCLAVIDCDKAVDEDWNSFASTVPGATGYIYENYTIPDDFVGATLTYKFSALGMSCDKISLKNISSGEWTSVGDEPDETHSINIDNDFLSSHTLQMRATVKRQGASYCHYYEGKVIWDIKSEVWTFNNVPIDLLNDEFASFTLQKIKEDLFEDDIIVAQVVNGSHNTVELKDSLVPGEYSVSVDLFYNIPDSHGRTKIVFESETFCVDEDWRGRCKRHQTIGPREFDETFPEGSSRIDFTLTKENLDGFDTIVLYVISSPDSSSFDMLYMSDLEMMGKSEEFSETYKTDLEPTFE